MRGLLTAAILMLVAQAVWCATALSAQGAEPLALRAADSLASGAALKSPQAIKDRDPLRLRMTPVLQPVLQPASQPALQPASPAPADGENRRVMFGSEFSEADHTRLAETLLTVLQGTLALIAIFIIVLLIYTTVVRLQRKSDERRTRRFRERWEDALYRRMVGDAISLPEIAPSERMSLLLLLIETIAFVRGDAADKVAAVARERGLASFVMGLLSSRSRWKLEIGIRAAGALRLTEALATLERLVAGERRHTALSAASALATIDAERGFAALEPLLWRMDWSTERIAGLIRTAGGSAARLLSSMLESAPPERLKQVIRMIEYLGERSMLPALRSRLAQPEGTELTAAILHALRALGDASDRLAVISHLKDAHWLVRMQAAFALGGLGMSEDADLLAPLLRDPNWWVRYRAAQSLLMLVGTGRALAALAHQSDAYARDILQRVLAERG